MSQPTINENLTGKVAIVTGATGGIGKEIARGLARMGATVIVGARNPTKGEAVVAEVKKDAKNPDAITTMTVDVSSFDSIRKFVSDFEKKHDALHALVINT